MADVRLIDANALHREIYIWMENSNKASSYADAVEGFAYSEVLDAINIAPTIDPESLRPQWISVKDRLPNAAEGDVFLAVSKNGGFVFEAYFERDCGRGENLWHDGIGNFYKITHWMPLPEPPEVSK